MGLSVGPLVGGDVTGGSLGASVGAWVGVVVPGERVGLLVVGELRGSPVDGSHLDGPRHLRLRPRPLHLPEQHCPFQRH